MLSYSTIGGVKLTLPIPLKLSLNVIYAGVHYRVRKQHKDLYRELVWALVREKYTGEYPVIITYHFKFKGRKLDSSNCAYLVKLMEDGLVHADVIPDDNRKYVAGSFSFVDEGKWDEDQVDITIEDAAIAPVLPV